MLGSRSFVLPDGTAGFVVRTGAGFVAYRNVCPHWNVDLDMGLGDFVDPRIGRIACRNHAAEFEVESGLCVEGPCAGLRLDALVVRVEGERVHISDRPDEG